MFVCVCVCVSNIYTQVKLKPLPLVLGIYFFFHTRQPLLLMLHAFIKHKKNVHLYIVVVVNTSDDDDDNSVPSMFPAFDACVLIRIASLQLLLFFFCNSREISIHKQRDCYDCHLLVEKKCNFSYIFIDLNVIF